MENNFSQIILVVLKNEGGYVNDPDDKGGETNFGIAKRYHPEEDIKNMTEERAAEIYYQKYWLPMNLREITDINIQLQIFDFGVNAGTRTSIKMAQRIAGAYPDGLCGPQTCKAINEYEDFLTLFKLERLYHYCNLAIRDKTQVKFLKGWRNRIIHTRVSP